MVKKQVIDQLSMQINSLLLTVRASVARKAYARKMFESPEEYQYHIPKEQPGAKYKFD